MSVLPAAPVELTAEALLAPILTLVPAHEHTWALRDVEYESGFSLNRFECESCTAVRFT